MRIFTPLVELPFAGHPVLGTIFALADAGRITPETLPASTLELAIGPLTIDLLFEGAGLSFAWMSQRIPTFTAWQGDRAALAANIGLQLSDLRDDMPIETGSAGTPHLLIPIRDAASVDRAAPGAGLAEVMGTDVPTGAYLFAAAASDGDVTVRSRMFGAMMGISEDPATGSAVGPLGAYLVKHGQAPVQDGAAHISVAQGVKMGRPSRLVVTVEQREGVISQVRVGGESVVMAHGDFMLPDAN
jgi:trans-2,3-dihydro-3-hydroxyanthranilate isomerase